MFRVFLATALHDFTSLFCDFNEKKPKCVSATDSIEEQAFTSERAAVAIDEAITFSRHWRKASRLCVKLMSSTVVSPYL